MITDVRTENELEKVCKIDNSRLYWIADSERSQVHSGCIRGSEIRVNVLRKCYGDRLKMIFNYKQGLYSFFRTLDKTFFIEDVNDLYESDINNTNRALKKYATQFNIERGDNR